MRFEFATAKRIIFGTGVLGEVGDAISKMGSHAFIVTGANPDRANPLLDILAQHRIPFTIFSIEQEPTVEAVQQGVEEAKNAKADVVISFGGGSALDAGKAIAALATNKDDTLDYLEVIGKGKPLTKAPMPFIAIPTTSGTGAEVTRNAVLKSATHKVKVSLRSPLMLPALAIVDPEIARSMPPDITASTGMDALTQVLEPFVSNAANPLTDSFCREGIKRAARSLWRAYEDGEDISAREDMARTSLFGGLALANAKLGAVHGFAGPLGGMYPAPHGAICARLLPYVMDANIQALHEREAQSDKLARFEEIARILTGNDHAEASDGVRWIQELAEKLKIPGLAQFGVKAEHLPEIISKAAQASSMKGNPIRLAETEMESILKQAL